MQLRTETTQSILEPGHINLRTKRMSDRSRRSIKRTKEKRRSSNTNCISARRRQLFTASWEATSLGTTSTYPEHALHTRQNSCHQSFCEGSGADISHFVVPKIEFRERGVRLVILHQRPPMPTHKWLHACMLSHTTAPA